MVHRIHDRALLDALEAIPPVIFRSPVWRICREERSPLQEWKVVGRWCDGSFPVIYTSLEPETAKAEVYFHYYQKQPVVPSRLQLFLHKLQIDLSQTLKLLDLNDLKSAGVTDQLFHEKGFSRVVREGYPVMQSIGAAANFLGFDGLLVPSARTTGSNAVLLTDNIPAQRELTVASSEPINLKTWFQEQT